MSNSKIWEKHCTTPEKATSPIMGGKMKGKTSVKPMYIIQRATEEFGPFGEGWGYDIQKSELIALAGVNNPFWMVQAQVWWGKERFTCGPTIGTSLLAMRDGSSGQLKLDEDAPKKALTDAVKKAFAWLGFAADVYMGLYDDDRYRGWVRDQGQAKLQPPVTTEDHVVNKQANELLPRIAMFGRANSIMPDTLATTINQWVGRDVIDARCGEWSPTLSKGELTLIQGKFADWDKELLSKRQEPRMVSPGHPLGQAQGPVSEELQKKQHSASWAADIPDDEIPF